MIQNTEHPRKILPEMYSRSQLTALYAKIPITEDESKLLRKYCLAMVNLYGMVPLKQAWKIVMEQNPGQFTRKQLSAFANIARHERDGIMILGDEEVYHDGPRSTPTNRTLYDYHILVGDTETFQRIRSGHQSKPYYIPEKKVLLRYHNSYYCQPTPESKALKAYLMELTGENKQSITRWNVSWTLPDMPPTSPKRSLI